jgi:hypothetical protein
VEEMDENEGSKPIDQKTIQDHLAERARKYAEWWDLREALGPDDVFARGRNPIIFAPPKLIWREYAGPTEDSSALEKQTAIRKLIRSYDEGKFRLPTSGTISALMTALDLRLALESNDNMELDELSSKEILERLAKSLQNDKKHLKRPDLSSLAESPRAWRIFKDGALARALSVDDKQDREYIERIQGAIDERIRNGRDQRLQMSMRELLENISQKAINDPEFIAAYEDMDWGRPETLLFGPASEEEIRSTEERLGVELPEDYNDFLRTSNGLKVLFHISAPPLHQAGK